MKIREFRSNMKAAFDAAKAGEKVEIRRDGVRYILVSEEAVKEARKQASPENKKNISEASPNPNMLAGEFPCCSKAAPCKHWVWDVQSGEGYKNSLSGRTREAE